MLLTKFSTFAWAVAFVKLNPNKAINPMAKNEPVAGPKKPS